MDHKALRRAATHSEAFLASLPHRHVATTSTLTELRTRLSRALPEQGRAPELVVDEMAAAIEGGQIGCASGRFFAWVIGGSLESAMALDWLTSCWDQNAALLGCSPAAAVVEEVAGKWLLELLDLPRNASFAFTTGCQMAHFTCLAAARHAVLTVAGHDVERRGMQAAPGIRVITGDQRHQSVDRALRFLGLGSDCVVSLSTDVEGRINIDQYEESFEDDVPTIVVLGAADINTGSFDDFARLIPIAKRHNAWVHVDGAFGLMARVSRSKRPYLHGVEWADSWATDGHKWLNVPFDNGLAIVRDVEMHKVSMTIGASYIAAEHDARDQIDWNPEWSRRARGFPVYAAILELGRQGLEELIDSSCRYAHQLVTSLGELPGVEVLWTPQLNQGLVRFLASDPDAVGEVAHAERTDAVIRAVNATGEAFFSGTTWRGIRAMRVSVVNWRTNENDVQRAVEAVRQVLCAEPH